ncbi:MAG: ABC transporter ATP-binding protein [Candidatus Eremiobacteraeota bacterium]|nr:ABC transporter ATP-binding protein [Candidatus Eremiobacteraeota bacterium]
MALALEGLSVARGGRSLLRDVTLALERGVVAILGANGAGKTTLLRTIAGMYAPSAGRVLLDGVDIRTLAPRERARRMALLEPTEGVLETLSVRDAVSSARFPHHRWWEWEPTAEDDVAIDEALARTALSGFAARELGTLSAGERQRVWVALAIAQRAGVVLFDEPTSHLDLRAAVETLALVRELADAGTLVVAVLHQLEEAAAFADRTIVLGEHRILADGPPADALTSDAIARAFDVEITVERRADGLAFHRRTTGRTQGLSSAAQR